MDENDEQIEDREHFIKRVIPEPVRTTIYERTHNFIFASDVQKQEMMVAIASDSEKLKRFQKLASLEEPLTLMEDETLDDLRHLIPEKFIRWAISERVDEMFYGMDTYYSEGYDAPWDYLEEDPENPDELEVDTTDRYWKKDIDLWSEDQRERAGDKAREQGEEYQTDDLIRNLRRYQRRDYGSTMNNIYGQATEYLTPENYRYYPDEVIEFMTEITNYFSDVSEGVASIFNTKPSPIGAW